MSRIGDFADDDLTGWIRLAPDLGAALAGFSEPERIAAEFAHRFATDHTALRDDDAFWVRAREHFSDELLADLTMSCAMWLGMGRMLRTLDMGQACSYTVPSRG